MEQDLENEQYVSKTKTTETQQQSVQADDIRNEPRTVQADDNRNEPRDVQTDNYRNEPRAGQTDNYGNEPRAVQADTPRQEPRAAQNERYTQTPDAVRSTVTDTSTRYEPAWSATGVRIVAFILGVVEVFLILRLILKLLAASTSSLFVRFIYGVSDVLILPFTGIFTNTVDTGMGSESVFEPAVLVAMLIYALVAWGLVKLIMIFRRKNRS